ncbi:hypothetical protein Patl1_23554 [Pistacia atlantica]|uniref:Uncharacterized protein n=1 Tax=Pistacia atlantica TaxID=434234 RepID=A0ACC0ZYI3_9ROSI|nr:hypothetical protein Patl1_23554 [Pistacia atlantica]
MSMSFWKSRPKLNVTIFFQALLCFLFGGSLYQYLFIKSLDLTTATFATAMTNLIPAVTFIMAISFEYSTSHYSNLISLLYGNLLSGNGRFIVI